MKLTEIQITPWGPALLFNAGASDLQLNDWVIVKTESGTEIGKVIAVRESKEEEIDVPSILRKATLSDLEKKAAKDSQKDSAMASCRELAAKQNLAMKLVDVHFSFDGSRITFAFIADSRIDFRELVKDLTKQFQRSIRMQQLGIRDEAKMAGDIGPCGRVLCCQSFLRELKSISSEFAELQQVEQRGSEKLTGVCGRLRCCLAFEIEHYRELAEKLPGIGDIIKTERGAGKVVRRHLLKQSVEVEIEQGTIIEVPMQ